MYLSCPVLPGAMITRRSAASSGLGHLVKMDGIFTGGPLTQPSAAFDVDCRWMIGHTQVSAALRALRASKGGLD